MNDIEFVNGIPLPNANIQLYRQIYEIENWLRRIVYAAFMLNTKWDSFYGIVPPKTKEKLKMRVGDLPERKHLDCDTNDNAIWSTTIEDMIEILEIDALSKEVKKLTDWNYRVLIHNLTEIKEIRNTISHNRTVTSKTLAQFNTYRSHIDDGIRVFQKNLIETFYDETVHQDNKEEFVPANIFLGRCKSDSFSFSTTRYFAKMTFLDIPDDHFIDCEALLENFSQIEEHIVAFIFDLTRTNIYSVCLPVGIKDYDAVTKMVDRFLSFNTFIKASYSRQNPLVIGSPKLWFCEEIC